MICRKDNNRNLCQVDGRHLRRAEKIKAGIYVKLGLYTKVGNLCYRLLEALFVLFLCL